MRNRGRFAAKAAGVFAAMALMVGLIGPAGAAEVDVSFLLQDGSEITTPGQVLPIFNPDNPMSSGIVGVWDDTTGDLTADLEIAPRFTEECTDTGATGFAILPTTISYEATEVVGNIDPLTGDAELQTAVTTTVEIPVITLATDSTCDTTTLELAANAVCTVPPVNIAASSSNPGGQPFDLDFDAGTFVVTEQGLDVGAATCTADLDLGQAVQDGLNDRFQLPTSEGTAVMDFVVGEIVPPEPLPTPSTSPPTTVAPAPPPAAAPIAATPRVTG